MGVHQTEGGDLVAAIKLAIAGCGLSLTKLAAESGVSRSQLSRFMKGERTLTLESAAKLFTYFGMAIHSGPGGQETLAAPEPEPEEVEKPVRRPRPRTPAKKKPGRGKK